MSIPPAPRTLVLAALAVTAASLTLATTIAQAAPQTGQSAPAQAAATAPAQAAGDDAMPSAVEDYLHPGAAQILQNQKITLKRGDGHLKLVDCQARHDVMVESRLAQKQFCFAVTGSKGYLALELPDAFGIWTEDHPVQAKITAEGKETVIDAAKNDYQPIGEAGSTGKRSVLVELRING
ncbi:hypothetical protein [Kitasatospora viridis]|uniref:Secreted protein n=1 Tax=Kitasatospora viridis TaxID=281105 RepID=A0A561SEU6_9ACTN|nr:hypothetical protein [Kitasatospora viridis]TWF73357.1 hypothetical protein FHX73_16508 [Kitasatospora viridis]